MTRNDLHELVDEIPETEIDHIAMLVRAVRENNRPPAGAGWSAMRFFSTTSTTARIELLFGVENLSFSTPNVLEALIKNLPLTT